MNKPHDNARGYTMASHAPGAEPDAQTPDASLLQFQGNTEGQSSLVLTSSQISNPSLLFSSHPSQAQEMAIAQALQVLKICEKPAEEGATFALLNDAEISEKLGSMNEQIQSLSSTVCIMAEDIFAKSALINKLTEKLERSERELVKFSTAHIPVQSRASCSPHDAGTVAIEGKDIACVAPQAMGGPPTRSSEADFTPPVSTVLINEPPLDLTPPLTVNSVSSDPPNEFYEPESPHCSRQKHDEPTVGGAPWSQARDLSTEITELKAFLTMQDKLIDALITVSNEEAGLLNILLNDEDGLEHLHLGMVDQPPEILKALDTIREAGIFLAGGDTSLRQRVQIRLKELQELRLAMRSTSDTKLEPDNGPNDRILSIVQKATESLSNLERAFCYFVTLGVLLFLFSQWVINPWKYN